MANIIVPGATRQTPLDSQVPRLPQDPTYDRIAAAASDVAQNWSQRELQDRADALRRARADAADQLSALGREFEEDTDFSSMEGRYGAAAEAIGAKIGEALPQAVREEFGLGFRDMARGQTEAVGRRAFSLRGDHARAELATALDRYRDLATGMDDDGAREGILGSAASDIAAAVSAGYITAEAAQEQATKFVQGVDLVRASRRLREDPEGFDPAAFRHLTADQRETMTSRKDSELERRMLKAEAETAKRERTAEAALGELKEAALSGLPLTDEYTADIMARLAPAGEAYTRRGHAEIRRTGALQSFAAWPAAKRDAFLKSLEHRGGSTSDEVEWFGRLQKLDMGITENEARAQAAALRELEQDRKEAEREARQEARELRTAYDKEVRELLGAHAVAHEDGAVFSGEERLAALVKGTEYEPEYQRNLAVGDLWAQWRAAPLEGKGAIAAQLDAMAVGDKRGAQIRREMIRDTEAAYDAWDSETHKQVNEELQALYAGSRLASYDATVARLQARGDAVSQDLLLTLSEAHTGYVNRGVAAGATSGEIFAMTSAGGAPLPRSAGAGSVDRAFLAASEAARKAEMYNPIGAPGALAIVDALDLTDLDSVSARVHAALSVTRSGDLRFLENAEAGRLSAEIPRMSSADQEAIWTNVIAAAGAHAPSFLRELDAPQVVIWAAEGQVRGGLSPALLPGVVRGAAALNSPAAAKPSAADLRVWAYEIVGSLFMHEPEDLSRAIETATALWASRPANLAGDPAEAKDAWSKSLQTILGGVGERGGIRMVSGRPTSLPSDMTAAQAQQALDRLKNAHMRILENNVYEDFDPSQGLLEIDPETRFPRARQPQRNPQSMTSVWGGITSNGESPVVRGQPIDWSVLRDLGVRALDGGLYELEFIHGGGEAYRLEDPVTGAPVTVDLKKLATLR